MAGRTSEKGNTTGKTIFCFIGKVIGAGITAFAILALFCVFYYNPPVNEPCGNGVTSYVRPVSYTHLYVLFQKVTFSSYLIYMLLMIIIGVVTYGIMLLILGDELVREEVRMIFGKLKHNEK